MKIPNWLINIILKQMGVSKTMDKIRAILSGKKTYLVSVGMIITAVIEYVGDNDLGKLINKVIEAVALTTVRAGISKTTV